MDGLDDILAASSHITEANGEIARLRAASLRVLTSWDQEDEPDIVDAFEALREVLGDPDTSRGDGLASLAAALAAHEEG